MSLAISWDQWRIQKFWEGFSLVVDPRCRGLGAQLPAAEKVSVFKSIQCNKTFNISAVDSSKLWLATLLCSSQLLRSYI